MTGPGQPHADGTLVAVVLACGGGLDALLLAGRPLIQHSIDQARAIPGVGRVSVVGDSAARETARECGVDAPDLGDDRPSPGKPLPWWGTQHPGAPGGPDPSTIVFLAAATPLRTSDNIVAAVGLMRRSGAPRVDSVARVYGELWTADGRVLSEPVYRSTRSIGVLALDLARAPGKARSVPAAQYEMDEESSLEVHSPADLDRVERVLRHRQRSRVRPLLERAALIVLDFDGVFTDNRVLVMQDGTEGVLCSRGDGLGLEMLRKSGLPIVVLSKEQNPVVAARCRKLKLECVQGIDDKLPELKRLAAQRGVAQDRVVYVGNDTNDLECLSWAGVPVVVADAHPRAIAAARLVLSTPGGKGAIRELCGMILEASAGATAGGGRL